MTTTVLKDAIQYVTIGLDREVFAIEVDRVREILDMCPLTRLPNAPLFLAGMIDVRGQGVPVIDLRLKLSLPPAAVTEQTRIVVIEVPVGPRLLTMGVVADRVFEVTPLEDRDLEAPPDVGIRWRSDYIRAIGRTNGDFVIIFDLAHLFTSEEAALVEARA